MTKSDPFQYFETSTEIIRLAVMLSKLNRAAALAEWHHLGAT